MARSVPAPAGHRGAWAQRCRRLRTVAARVPAAKLCAGWEVGARSRRGEGPPPPPPRARERAGPRRAPAPRVGGARGRTGSPAAAALGRAGPDYRQPYGAPVCWGQPRQPHLLHASPAASAHGRSGGAGPRGSRRCPLSSANPSPSPEITVQQLPDPSSRPAPRFCLLQSAFGIVTLSPHCPQAMATAQILQLPKEEHAGRSRGTARCSRDKVSWLCPLRIWSRVDRFHRAACCPRELGEQ